jgi:hypothetical protein
MIQPPFNQASLWKGHIHLSIYDINKQRHHQAIKQCERDALRKNTIEKEDPYDINKLYSKYSEAYWAGVKKRQQQYRLNQLS